MAARAVGKALPHDSAHLHVAGTAAYTDDLPEPRDLLHLAVGMSPVAHAQLHGVDLANVVAEEASSRRCYFYRPGRSSRASSAATTTWSTTHG